MTMQTFRALERVFSTRADSPIVMIGPGNTRHALFREISDPYADVLANLSLSNGSLLIMHPHLQKKFLHYLPKPDRTCGQWMSLIFSEISVPTIGKDTPMMRFFQRPLQRQTRLGSPPTWRVFVRLSRYHKTTALRCLQTYAKERIQPELINHMGSNETRAEMFRLLIDPTDKRLEKAALANILNGAHVTPA